LLSTTNPGSKVTHQQVRDIDVTNTIKPESPPQDAGGFALTEAEMIAGRREWLKQLAEKTVATKHLLLEGRDDDASTEAIFDMWCKCDDYGRLDLLAWAWFNLDRIGRRPWSRLLAMCWLRPKVVSLVTDWGAWGVRRVTTMFERAIPEYLMKPDVASDPDFDIPEPSIME
jgi:hypothetical protein